MASEDLLTLQSLLWTLQRVYYVYAICEPDGTPFYIGKGTGDRVRSHEIEARDPANNASKHQVIREIKDSGLEVRYRLLGLFSDEDDAHQEEKHLIAKYGRRNNGTGILTNLTDGGEGYVETFLSEKWQTDENGVRVLRGVGEPSKADLLPPNFRTADDLILEAGQDGEDLIKGWKKPQEWTGPEKPLLVQWQGHGLTVQVFFSENTELSLQAWLRDPLNKDEDMRVIVRVFDGERNIFEDTSAFFPFPTSQFRLSLCSTRPRKPSSARLATERMLVASILCRLADMADELAGPVRYDWAHGSMNWTKRQQAWIRHNHKSLRRIVAELEAAAGNAGSTRPP